MKLAIMQPYFFPYLGYFDLIHNVDLFIIYDTVQYIKHGWIHRNRILHPYKEGWHYIAAQMDRSSFHSSYKTPIMDVKTASGTEWKEHLVAQLAHYEKFSPRGREMTDFVRECLNTDESFISRLNVHILERFCRLLKINFEYRFCSDLGIALDPARSAQERVLELCQFLGAKEYVNLPGGTDLYQAEVFEQQGIQLSFRTLPAYVYETGRFAFEPNLSIIDVLMWNRPEDVKRFLDNHCDEGYHA